MELVEVKELEEDWNVKLLTPTKQTISILIPKSKWVLEQEHPFGLNLVTAGHYE